MNIPDPLEDICFRKSERLIIKAHFIVDGIFGDHCSPISDTTCVSAIASGCDLLKHVKHNCLTLSLAVL